jgi:hypothetical protein
MASNDFVESVLGTPAGNLNPATGLQDKGKKSSSSQSFSEFISSNNVNPSMGGGDRMELDPNKFSFQPKFGADNVELRAQDQSWGEQTLYGAGRLVATTATKFLEGFGYLYGVGDALMSDIAGPHKTLGAAMDNGWTNFFSNLEDSVKESMPIYHTNKYNQGNILDQMGTWGYWMDDMVDGLAFLASAFVGSKGIQTVGKGVGAYGKLAKAFAQTTRAYRTGDAAAMGTMNLRLAKVVRDMDLLTMTAFNSATEAGFEAKDTMDSLMAQGMSKEEAAKAATGVFKWNMGVLMVPNYITNSMFFGKVNPMKGRITQMFENGALKEGVAEVTKLQKVGAFGQGMLTSMASEGAWEENMQLAVQNYYKDKALGKESRGQFEAVFGNALNNFTTDEGQKSIVAGMLIGMIPGGVHGIREVKAEQVNEKTLHAIVGHTLQAVTKDMEANDIWLRYGKDNKEGKAEGDIVINPKTGKALIDPAKAADYLAGAYYSGKNILLSAMFKEAGNNIMEDRMEEENLASLAYSMVGHPDGVEAYKGRVKDYAQQKAEKFAKDGIPLDQKQLDNLIEKYQKRGELYRNIYQSIENNYGGLMNFYNPMFQGKSDYKMLTALSQMTRERAMRTQFMSAVDQLFWADKKADLQKQISEKSIGPQSELELNKDLVQNLTRQVEDVDKVLESSRDSHKKLLDFKTWETEYNKQVKVLEDAAEKGEDTTPAPVEEKPTVVKDSEGNTYTYKGKDEKGNHTLVDTAGKERTFTTKQLDEAGIVINDEAAKPLTQHVAETEVAKPEITHADVTEAIAEAEAKITESVNEEDINKARKESVIDELSNRVVTQVTGAESEAELRKLSTIEAMTEKYGDRNLASLNLQTLLATVSKGEDLVVVYQDEVGTLFIDEETNEVIFRGLDSGKEYTIGKTTDEQIFAGEITTGDLGIIPLKHTLFDIQLEEDGIGINIQGRRYLMDTDNPLSVIEHDENGLPIAVTVKDVNGVSIRMTNPALVEELAYSIALLEEARETAYRSYLNEFDSDFIVINDPKNKSVKYYVYPQVDGSYKVVKPFVSETGVLYFKKVTNPKQSERIVKALFNDLGKIIDRVAAEHIKEGQRATEEQRKEIKKRIQDEVKQFVEYSRSASEKEVIASPAASEVSNLAGTKDESSGKQEVVNNTTATRDTQTTAGSSDTGTNAAQPAASNGTQGNNTTGGPAVRVNPEVKKGKEEAEIVDEAAAKIAEERKKKKPTTTKGKETVDQHLGIEPENTTDPDFIDTSVDKDKSKGLLHPATAVAWKAEDNPALDAFLSNPSNDLTGFYLLAEIDYEYEDMKWKWTEETSKKEFIDKQLSKIDKTKGEDRFNSLVDRIPIKLTLIDKTGKALPFKGMYLHSSEYDNVLVDQRLKDLKKTDPVEFELQYEVLVETEKKLTRSNRGKIIRSLIEGNEVRLVNLDKGRGVLSQTPGENRSLLDVTDTPDEGDIVIADGNGTMFTGDGRIVPGKASPGNVLWNTNQTANGTEFPVKLNVAKLSEESAKILLRAYQIAATSPGGIQALYDGPEVEGNLTVKEIINYLVLDGPITNQLEASEKGRAFLPHLMPKTLYMNEGILHYGNDFTLDMRKKITPEEAKKFIDHVTKNKNYVVPISNHSSSGIGLGTRLSKTFRIGSIRGSEKQSYQSFLITNNMVQTDLIKDPATGRFFSKPAFMFELQEAPKKKTTKKPVVVEEEEAPKKGEVTKEEAKAAKDEAVMSDDKFDYPRLKNEKDIAKLPVGTDIFVWIRNVREEGEEGVPGAIAGDIINVIGRVVNKDGQPVLSIEAVADKQTAKNLSAYEGLSILDPKVGELLTKSFQGVPIHAEVAKSSVQSAPVTGKTAAERIAKAGEEDAPFAHLARLGTYEKADVDKAIKYLQKVFGKDVAVEKVNKLIEVATKTGNRMAWGTFTRDVIRLSESMEKGTEYHEAFHRVSLLYLSPEQRSIIHGEARVRYNMKDSTEREVNERLSEEWRKFSLANGTIETKGSRIKQFFTDLFDFIKTFFTGKLQISNLSIDNLFRTMSRSGRFSSVRWAKPNRTSYEALAAGDVFTHSVKGRELKYINNTEQLTNIVNNLVYNIFTKSGVFKTKDIGSLKYNYAKDVMSAKRDQAWLEAEIAKEQGDIAGFETLARFSSMFGEVVDNFDIFSDLIRSKMEALGIKTIVPENPEDETDGRSFNLVRYDKASFELDSKDNAGTAIKFVISTLRATSELNSSTLLHQFVDYDTMYDTLRNDMSELSTVQEMIDVLKSKDTQAYKDLLARINKDRETDKFDTLATQFFHAMRKNRMNYVNGLIDMRGETGEIGISSAESQKESSAQAVVWGQNFIQSPAFKDGKPNANYLSGIIHSFTKLANAVRNEYNNKTNDHTLPSYEAHFNELLRLFDKISVPVDETLLKLILNKVDSVDKHAAMYNFLLNGRTSKMAPVFGTNGVFGRLARKGEVTDNKGRSRLITDIFKNESLFRDVIAPAYLELKGGVFTNTILGPDGNPYYLVSENNYMSDFFHKLRVDPSWFNLWASVGYNRGSFVLNQMKDPEVRSKVDIAVFSSLSMMKANDRGRGFADINDAEDLLVKMGMFENDLIALPQIADRRHLYAMKGLKALSFHYLYDSKTKKLTVPGNMVQVFVNYAIDELNQINRVKKEIADAIAHGKEDTLKANMHYVLDKNGERDYKEANGLKWQHFTDFNGKKITKEALPGLVTKILEERIQDGLNDFEKKGVIQIKGKDRRVVNRLFGQKGLENYAKKNFGDKAMIELAIKDKIANFTLNSIMATIESEKVLFMSPAYYKNLDDKIKRYTAIASTGSTSRIDFSPSVLRTERLLHDSNRFFSTVLKTQKYKLDEKTVKELNDQFVERYQKLGLTKEQAETKAKQVLGKFNDVDPTDGQAYITPEMFRAMHIRLGEWNDIKEEAYDLLNAENMTLEEQLKVDQLFMQPLKFGYYGPELTPNTAAPIYYKMSLATLTPQLVKGTQLETLYQMMNDKSAPVDMVLFDSAVKTGVAQSIEFYARDEKGNIDYESPNISDLLFPPRNTASFEYLRKQVVTDPHNEMRTFVGTQFRKVILSNIVDGNKYTVDGKEMTGKQIKEENKLLTDELSNRGKNEFLDVLGVDQDSLTMESPDAMFKMLRDKARMSSMPDAFVDALAPQVDGSWFELDALPDRKWIQSSLVSALSKKSVDLHLPGTSLIQMANFGLRKTTFDDSLQLIDKDGFMEAKVSIEVFRNAIPNYNNLTHEERVTIARVAFVGIGYRIPTQGLVSTVPLKIVDFLPATSTSTISLPSAFTTLTGSDFDIDKLYFVRHNYDIVGNKPVKVKYLTDKNSTVDERLDVFSHEGIAIEVAKLKRARYTAFENIFGTRADAAGLIAQMRDELNAVVDNEEDVDKSSPEYIKLESKAKSELNKAVAAKRDITAIRDEYMKEVAKEIEEMRKDWKSDHMGEFIKDRSITQQNTKKALENRLVDTYFGVLKSADHIVDNYTPLDAVTGDLKALADGIAKLEGIERNYPALHTASFVYQSEVKHKYLWGKNGIGPFARANVHHILGQLVKLHLWVDIGVGHTIEVPADDYVRPSTGQVIKRGGIVTDLSRTHGVDNEAILDWLSALINAHVDIAKDAYIFNLNVNNATYNVGELLIRAGAGGKNTFLYLAQPILKEFAQASNDSRGQIVPFKGNPFTMVKTKYKNLLKAAVAEEGLKKIPYSTGEMFNEKRLNKDINANTAHDAAFYARQLQILSTFQEFKKLGQSLFEAVESVQIDTKRFGKNLAELRKFTRLVNKVLDDNVIANMDKMFSETFLGNMYQNSVMLAQKLFKDTTIMASEGVANLQDRIIDEIGQRYNIGFDSTWYTNLISDEIYTAIASRFMVNDLGVNRGKLTEMMFGDTNMVSRLNRIKNNPKYSENPFIRLLQPSMTFEKATPDFIITFGATDVKTKWSKDRIIDGWSELLTSSDAEVAKFAEDMVPYSFFTSGFRKTIYSVYNFIPPSYLKQVGFTEFIGNMRQAFNEGQNAELLEVIHDEVFQSMWGDDKIVPFVGYEDLSNRRKPAGWKAGYPSHVSVDLQEASKLYLGVNKFGEKIFKPFIKSTISGETVIYKLIGYLTDSQLPVYEINKALGYKNAGKVLKEYGIGESIIEDNHIDQVNPQQHQDIIEGVRKTDKEKGTVYYDYANFEPYTVDGMQITEAYNYEIDEFEASVTDEAPMLEPGELLEDYSQTTGQTMGSMGINISSYEETGKLGQQLSNFAAVPVTFNGVEYDTAEKAYQTEKKKLTDLSDENVLNLMTDIITAKLQQNPGLWQSIAGSYQLNDSTHNLVKNGRIVKEDRWTGKDGLFMQALRAAYVKVQLDPSKAVNTPLSVVDGLTAEQQKKIEDKYKHCE